MKVINGSCIVEELKLADVPLPDNVIAIDTHAECEELVTITYTCHADANILIAFNRGLARLNSESKEDA